MENTMDYSRMSREQLERTLLEDVGTADHPAAQRRRSLLRTRLAVARELLLRGAREELLTKSLIDSPAAARDYLRLHFAALGHEVFVAVFLDAQNRVLACEEAFRGTLTQTSVFPREIVRAALWHGASACLFSHNHPSGATEPSRADELLTRTLREALALVDVRVVDHLIFAGGQFNSFAERGLL
jgi:DNA repair protein RadC